MCVRGINFVSVSTIYSIRIWNDFDSVVFFCFCFCFLFYLFKFTW